VAAQLPQGAESGLIVLKRETVSPRQKGVVMASRSSPSKRLKRLAAEIPPDNAIHSHLLGLERLQQGDYALAMIGASFVDKALEVAILSRLAPMSTEGRAGLFDYSHNGPLSDLSSRILLARAMGLFGPKTFHDLQRIREIRNAFAHSLWYITFGTPEVDEMCAGFHSTARIVGDRRIAGATARAKFVHATRFVAGALKTRIQAIGLALNSPLPPPDDRLP
jgi:hypothetical protein